MQDSDLIFILNEETDKPIRIIHDDYTTSIEDRNYIFTKKEKVIINSEEHLMKYITMKLREGYSVNINNKNSDTIVNIEL